jgi:hypothetical protein
MSASPNHANMEVSAPILSLLIRANAPTDIPVIIAKPTSMIATQCLAKTEEYAPISSLTFNVIAQLASKERAVRLTLMSAL